MKVMLLAAGVGERMRPLTDHTPKALLRVAGRPLVEHHIRRLAAAGFTELVINVSYLAGQLLEYCGDGSRWGVSITWSPEPQPLETAGGIVKALPLLGVEPFLVVNADIWTDYPFTHLANCRPASSEGAYLVLVDNPDHHPDGDFVLADDGMLGLLGATGSGLTYAGVAVYNPEFFAGVVPGNLPLLPLLQRAIRRGCLQGEYYRGQWIDVGTPDRLRALDAMVSVEP